MSLSARAKSEILKMQARAKFPYLITITAPDGTEYRYANSDENIRYDNKIYESCYFTLSLPEKTDEKIGNGSINISVVDQTWIKRIRDEQKRFTLSFQALIIYKGDSDWITEPIEEAKYTLTSAIWDDSGVLAWTFVFDEKMDIIVPFHKFDAISNPALV